MITTQNNFLFFKPNINNNFQFQQQLVCNHRPSAIENNVKIILEHNWVLSYEYIMSYDTS